MPAGLAMCGILFMVAKTTPRANDLFFCDNVYPFLDDAAHLPGYEDDAWKYHKHSGPFPRLGLRSDIAESYCCERYDSEIECISESPNTWVWSAFNMEKEAGRNEKNHEYG